jgi:hypothetical protein
VYGGDRLDVACVGVLAKPDPDQVMASSGGRQGASLLGSVTVVRPFFARSAPLDSGTMGCRRRTRRSLPSVHLFSVG